MTAIYQLMRGFDIFIWLCDGCLAKRVAAGWEVRNRKEPPHEIRCQDCPR